MRSPKVVSRNRSEKSLLFQYLAFISGTLNAVCSGMHYGWASPTLPKLLHEDSHIPMTSDEAAWIAVMLMIGAVFGSILGGILLDRIGRKTVILLSSAPFFTSWIMLAFGRSVLVLIIGRFVAGIGDGLIFCSVSMYLGEIADAKIRGCLASGVAVSWIFGMLLINVIGSYLSTTKAALISSITPALLVLTFCWIPESPYYLIMKGNLEQAKKSLKVFNGKDDVELELVRLTQAVAEQTANTGKYLDLFTKKSNRRSLYIMLISRGVQQFCGPVAIMFYAQIIFSEAGDSISPTNGSIIYFGVQLMLSGFSSAIVDRSGRRPLIIISIIGTSVALLIEGCYFYMKNIADIDVADFHWVPIVALIVFVVVFSVGMQTIPILLLSEVFSTDVKAFALSFADVYYAVLAAFVSKLFQILNDSFGMHVPFLFFAACGGFGLVLITFYIPETKGKTLEDIQEELKK